MTILMAGGGDDSIDRGDGDDFIYGYFGADTVSGGDGDDTVLARMTTTAPTVA